MPEKNAAPAIFMVSSPLFNVFCWVMPICFMVSSPFHLCFLLGYAHMFHGFITVSFMFLLGYHADWRFQTSFIFHFIWDVILPIDEDG
jgi:hypothetical protein